MTIDGYYVPDEIANSAQLRADRLGKTQHVGVIYENEPPITGFRAVAHSFFRDLAVGRYCTWVYGPSYDELKQVEKLAVVLWISPRRAA